MMLRQDTKTGLWPLHLAVVYGLHHVLRRMLDKPIPDVVDVEVRDARGLTPLLLAGLVGDHESFMQLVKAGASPKVHTHAHIRSAQPTCAPPTTGMLRPLSAPLDVLCVVGRGQ